MFYRGKILYENRGEAGRTLTRELMDYRGRNPVVLGIPRGGVPVAALVADVLEGELDVIVVKKLGAPGNPELAIGAVGESGDPFLNEDVVDSLQVSEEYLREETKRKRESVRELLVEFRDVTPRSEWTGRTVILVDDGIATGATARACLEIIAREDPKTLVLAVPVAPAETLRTLREQSPADDVVCPHEIEGFFGGISGYYTDFGQVSSNEVRNYLKRYARTPGPSPGDTQ